MNKEKEDAKKEVVRTMSFLAQKAKEQGQTGEILSKKTGFITSAIWRMLSGRFAPGLDNFKILCEAIGIRLILKPKGGSPPTKFLLCVDPETNQDYVLHLNYPFCLLSISWINDENFEVLIKEVFCELKDSKSINSMPFIKEAEKFYKENFRK